MHAGYNTMSPTSEVNNDKEESSSSPSATAAATTAGTTGSPTVAPSMSMADSAPSPQKSELDFNYDDDDANFVDVSRNENSSSGNNYDNQATQLENENSKLEIDAGESYHSMSSSDSPKIDSYNHGQITDYSHGGERGSDSPSHFNRNYNSESHADSSGTVPISRATMLYAMCAALNSCNLGYDIGVNTAASKLLQAESSLALSDRQLELFMGSLNMFAAIGAMSASAISDRFGRRGGFLVAAVGFITGVLLMASATSYVGLMMGRVMVGLGVGFGLAIDPIYIAEISPAAHRGRLVTWSEIAINVGILFGFSTGLIFYKVEPDAAWRTMFSLGAVLPICLIGLVITVMPESPRWLVSKGRMEEAKVILEKVYPPGYDVNAVVQNIHNSLKREQDAERAMGWDIIFFPSPAFRRMLFVGLGSAVAQQIVGIDAIQYFLTFIIEEAGVKGRVQQSLILIFLGILKMSVIFLAGSLFDKRGRRPLLFVSLVGMAISLLIMAFTFLDPENNGGNAGAVIGVIGLASYLCFFSAGMGPACWLIPAEVFSTSIRAKAMSMATFLNRIAATIVTSSFLTVANTISWTGFFFMLSLICILTLWFFAKYLPETKGRSLEDMSMYFAELTGDRSILDAEQRLHSNDVNAGGTGSGSGSGRDGPSSSQVPISSAVIA